LCELLLAHRSSEQAKAEIASLAAETSPDNGAWLEENGRLFLRVGEPGKALAEFEAALKTDPHQSEWLAAAGGIAFEAGDFSKAETFFSRAERENPSEEIHASLSLARDVLRNDPFLAGLSEEEQARRTWRDFEQGLERLRSCAGTDAGGSTGTSQLAQPPSNMQLLDKDAQDLRMRMNLSTLAESPDLRNEAMRLVFRIENVTSGPCGPATGQDQAMNLIEKRHEGTNP
jgi:tetratricopeptide (TPR) repeat protein